jgi:MFS transporter, DHA1 family, inner membrane transport protein
MNSGPIDRSWVLPVFALFLAAFAVGTTEFIIAGLLPALATDLAVDIPTAGLLISGYAIGVAVGGPLLALVTGGLPRRPLLLILMAIFILGNALCALAPSYWLLLSARLVIAGTHGLFFGVTVIVATRLVPKERQASAVSFVIAGITLANVLGVPIGTAIGNAYGWRATFWAIAVIGIGATLALAALIPRTTTEESQHSSSLISEIRAIGRQTVLLSYVMITFFMTATFAVYTYIVPLLLSVTGVSTATVPWLLFVAGVGGVGGNLFGGRLGDWKPMPAVIAVFALVLAIYLAMLVAVYDPVAMTVTFFLWWLIGFSFAAPAQARILKGAADAPNLASTLISTAFNIGIAAGPWLGGIALNAGWGYARLPWIAVFFVAAALAVAILSAVLERRVTPALAAA